MYNIKDSSGTIIKRYTRAITGHRNGPEDMITLVIRSILSYRFYSEANRFINLAAVSDIGRPSYFNDIKNNAFIADIQIMIRKNIIKPVVMRDVISVSIIP